MSESHQFYNEDCIEGCRRRIHDGSVDLIITDPPYGIKGDTLHKHYNRKEEFVLEGYIEVPAQEYPSFSKLWIKEAARILRPGGALYVVSGYTNLIHILNALHSTKLKEINHIIWKYNFGVYASKKYISSHYHILYYVKPGGSVTFNTFCRFGADEKSDNNGSRNYGDREDVWIINREYKPGKTKNKNELPIQLLTKVIQYSSNEGDVVCDLFLGGFSTAKVAIGLNRRAIGFEKSPVAFAHQLSEIAALKPGFLLGQLHKPQNNSLVNQGKPWSDEEKLKVWQRYRALMGLRRRKSQVIQMLSGEFGRGRWSLIKFLDEMQNKTNTDSNSTQALPLNL